MSITTNFDAANNNLDSLSFGLLRTNPVLTTNVKVVVDSNESIYMDSIDANSTLSNSAFKKFSINPEGKYSQDLSIFYKTVPNSIKYDVLRQDSDLSVYGNYAKQYEDQYQYGAYFNSSKFYLEQYRFFAPIWLEKNKPSYFVIYRVEDVDYTKQMDMSVSSQNSRIMELLSKATIVKTFDLTQNSNIGKYINNHINDSKFPSASITQNFDPSQATIYSGIDTAKGGFVDRKEYTNKDLITDKIEILNNSLLTGGFQRNDLAVANIMNLEFLFNDTSAETYKIYRYFGLYVDAVQEGKFTTYNLVKNDSTELLNIEKDSVETLYPLSNGLTHQDMFINQSDLSIPTLNWVKSGVGNFFHVRNGVGFDNTRSLPVSLNGAGIEEFTEMIEQQSIQIEDSFGLKLNDILDIQIVESPKNGDKIFIAPKSELHGFDYKLYHFEFCAVNNLPIGKFTNNTYSNQGTLSDIAGALAGAINLSVLPYTVQQIKDRIILQDYGNGNTRKLTAFGILNANVSNFIQINEGLQDNIGLTNSILPMGSQTDFTQWTIWTPVGGAVQNKAVLIKNQNKGSVAVGEFLKSSTSKTYSKIIQIVADPFLNQTSRIILEKAIDIPKSKILNVFTEASTQYGKFSAYTLKDFDFDFYDTSNSKLGELTLEDLLLGSSYYSNYAASCNPNFTEQSSSYFPTLYSVLQPEIVNRRSTISNLSQESNLVIKDTSVNSEYDRLSENELKETAVLSRLVPTINKFALKDSFNARMKPYLLTFSESFGTDNMSPDIQSGKSRDPLDYSMEHFHIYGIPEIFKSSSANINELDSYLGYNSESSNTNNPEFGFQSLISTDKDYFSKYFIWDGAYRNNTSITKISYDNGITSILFGDQIDPSILNAMNKTITKLDGTIVTLPDTPYINTINGVSSIIFNGPNPGLAIGDLFLLNGLIFVKDRAKKLYSNFDKGSQYKFASTVFRGLRYTYKARKEFNKINPTEFIYNTEVNDYKFGSVINLVSNATTNGYSISVVKNDVFNFICVYISLQLNMNDVNELTRKVLYELIHSKLNGSYNDSYMSGVLDLRNAAWSSGPVTINGIADQQGNGTKFESQLTLTEAGGYSYLVFNWPVNSVNQYALKVLNVVNDSTIIVDGYPRTWDSINKQTGSVWTGIAAISANEQTTMQYTYVGGGYNAFKTILESLQASSFAKLFNEFSTNINYLTVGKDGSLSENTFVLEIDNGTSFAKGSYIEATVDPDKPNSYKITSQDIGKIISKRNDPYFTAMRRMNGSYNPLTKDIVSFTDIFTEYKAYDINGNIDYRKKLIYDKFSRLGIAFDTYVSTNENGFGLLNNYYFHKVNPEAPDSTLKLSTSSDKLPLYPKIGEIAIDKKTMNVLESKYSPSYFTKASPNNATSLVYGTLSPIEKKAFLTSTIMKVHSEYAITNFTANRVNSLDQMNTIRINDSETSSIVWFEDTDKVYADVYVKKSMFAKLLADGIKPKFDEYVKAVNSYGDSTTTLDDLQVYTDNNIVPRFNLGSIIVYAKEGKDISTDFIGVADTSLIDTSIFSVQTNYQTQTFPTDRLGFRLIYNKRPGYNYQFELLVNIIS